PWRSYIDRHAALFEPRLGHRSDAPQSLQQLFLQLLRRRPAAIPVLHRGETQADTHLRFARECLARDWFGATRQSRSALAEASLHKEILGVLFQHNLSRQRAAV